MPEHQDLSAPTLFNPDYLFYGVGLEKIDFGRSLLLLLEPEVVGSMLGKLGSTIEEGLGIAAGAMGTIAGRDTGVAYCGISLSWP